MKYFDYTDVKGFLYDDELIRLLCADEGPYELLQRLSVDDLLAIDRNLKIPFFAEVRDYIGAFEKASPGARWIVKAVDEDGALKAALGALCFFLDFSTRTISAPTIVTRIDGVLYKATKILTHAEQLTGANYTDIRQLKEQLLLDLINRWIYYDEDRNPNNYLIHYTSKNDQVVIAIDYSNVDLLHEEMKIKGRPESFGWERTEKTRYLTPLKVEHFLGYDMKFFNMRMDAFTTLDRKTLLDLCKTCLRYQKNRVHLEAAVTNNLLRRIGYVRDYFMGVFPQSSERDEDEKYRDMGKTFRSIYGKENRP
jgi:hypothetical protein